MGIRVVSNGTGKRATAVRKNVQVVVNGYCLTVYGDAYTGGTPRRLALASGAVWVTPVIFTSAGAGRVADVGVVAVDARTLQVLDATPKSEVRAAGARLAREKRDVLETAFRRARTA